MSGIEAGAEHATRVHLDYQELSAGQVVIVIHGLPTTDDHTLSLEATAPGAAPPARAHRSFGLPPSSPLSEEIAAMTDAISDAPALFAPLMRAAWRGQEARATELIGAMIEDVPKAHEQRANRVAAHARALLYNGLARYEDALAAAKHACAQEDLGSSVWAVSELIEAAARSNARGLASEALRCLEERASADAGHRTQGIRARSAALLSEGKRAERLYNEAIELLDRDPITLHLARARLVYGEWLRREHRRIDAREQLRAARDTFGLVAASAFAERANRELLATGETARKRVDETRDQLTPQEAEIARLARDGLSNPEIGAQLFISPRTAQYHLRKVFQKLNIHSRHQLRRLPLSCLGSGEADELVAPSPRPTQLQPSLASLGT